MPRCPRCHSSMLLDYTDPGDGPQQRLWRCLGCGRESLADRRAQAEEDRLLAHVREMADQRG